MTNRRQHTIPQFYLRPFLTPGIVYKRGAIKPRKVTSPRHVSDREHYYGREEIGQVTLDLVNRKLETDGAPSLRKLVENPHTITIRDWVDLSWLLANLWMRTPVAINEMLATYRGFYSQINAIVEPITEKVEWCKLDPPYPTQFQKYDNSFTMTLDDFRVMGDTLEAEDGYLVSLNSTFRALPNVAKCIQRMTFLIVEAPPLCKFITSDRPVVLRSRITDSRIGAGWGNSDAMVTIPLSPTRLLVMFYYELGTLYCSHATHEDVELLNMDTLRFADSEVFSHIEQREAFDWMKGLGRWQR